jgi:hypothetical protein
MDGPNAYTVHTILQLQTHAGRKGWDVCGTGLQHPQLFVCCNWTASSLQHAALNNIRNEYKYDSLVLSLQYLTEVLFHLGIRDLLRVTFVY